MDDKNQTVYVKGSNIGFLVGILLVVGLSMYLYKSGFIAEKFGGRSTATPTPIPSASLKPISITDEPITLLEEDSEDEESAPAELATTPTPQPTHKPVDTAIGDNPLSLLALFLGSAGLSFVVAKKLEA